jgi:hypothetical protein
LPCPLQPVSVSERWIEPRQAAPAMLAIIGGTALGLAVLWLVMVLRYGWQGVSGCLAGLVQVLLLLATIQVLRVAVTLPLVTTTSVVVLVAALSNAWICECVRRSLRARTGAPSGLGWGLFWGVLPVGLLLLALAVGGTVAYVLEDKVLTGRGFPVVAGSLAAALTSCLCLPVLVMLFGSGPPRPAEGAIFAAELVGLPGPSNSGS